MARGKKKESALTPEEKLAQALVPDWEQPYKVPQNWCWTRLKMLSAHISDGSHNPPKDAGSGIPLLSATNIRNHSIDVDGAVRWITESEWETENQRTKIEPNDVLLTIVATLGRTAVVRNEKFALQRSVAVIKPRINSEFLSYYFETPYVQTFIVDNAKGTAQKGFYLNSLENLFCCVPPLAEQQRIVDRIEYLFAKLDEAKEKAQSVLDSFETRKAAILHKAFTGELTAKWRAENGVDIANWKETVLQDVCEKIVCGKTPTGHITAQGEIPYLKVYNIVNNHIDFLSTPQFIPNSIHNSKLQSSILKPNDVIMNIVGPPLRKIAIIPDTYPEWNMNQAIVRFRPLADLQARFLYYALINPETLDDVIAATKGVVGQANISVSQSRNLVVNLPSVPEQREIVRNLDSLFSKEQQAKEAAEAVLEKIDLLKKSILARAFRGELGTNDPTEESALELLKKVL